MKKLLVCVFCMLVMLVYGCAEDVPQTSQSESSKSGAPSSTESRVESTAESLADESLVSAGESTAESSAVSDTIDLPSADDQESILPDESYAEEVSEDEPSEDEPEDESSEDEPEDEPSRDEEPSQPEESTSETSEDEPVYTIGDAEWIESGYLLYNGAAYSQTYYNPNTAKQYAEIYARYAERYPEIGIHVINHPSSVISITNPAVLAMTQNQREVLDNMQKHIYGDVNFVNLGATFEEHRGEYLYFKSDFHWTQLGAYYAYCEFAKSVGLEPTPLSAFEEVVTTDKFIGLTNTYANDPRINSFYDTIHVYFPTKEHTMAVYLSDMSLYRVYDNSIQTSILTYSCYLTGDQAFSVINVPENDQSKTILVIKESSANAFVPFLTEHYGNIIVIDPRHISLDVNEVIAEYGVKDIIFFATASTCSRDAYYKYYCKLLGD